MAAGTGMIVVLSFRYANFNSGRLAFGYGTLSNPNDFAAYLLIGAPFCVYALLRAGKVMKVFWAASILILLSQCFKTGSRGALLAIAVLAVYLFFKAPIVAKLGMVACFVIGIAAMPLVLPRSVLERYVTILGGDSDETGQDSRQREFAESSTEGRKQLLLLSIEQTIKHPITGVGIGMFSVAGVEALRSKGEKGKYLQSHNTYTQLSSETGLVGFGLYMAAVWFAIADARFLRRHGSTVNASLPQMGWCLQASWILVLVTAMFGSMAYHMPILFLLGLSHAVRQALNREVAMQATARAGTRGPIRPLVLQPAYR
jgi:O-antigen ligase